MVGALRASRVSRGTYQCTGPTNELTDGHIVAVNATLETTGSCAAVWFLWRGNSGYLARLCQDQMDVSIDRPDSDQLLQTFPLSDRVALRTAVRMHLVIRDGTVDLYRGDTAVGGVALTQSDLTRGQVRLGISAEALGDRPSYRVSFTNIDIRSLAG
jgi:hypothetical protein